MKLCPCGLSKDYEHCCGVFIEKNIPPETPEALMRSRYTAYTLANIDYIQKTMGLPASLNFDAKEASQWAKEVNWLQLNVLNTSQDGNVGIVEFAADYSHGGKKFTLHEISRFEKRENKWFYISGTEPTKKPLMRTSKKYQPNEPCPCKSGKKYKKCCKNQ